MPKLSACSRITAKNILIQTASLTFSDLNEKVLKNCQPMSSSRCFSAFILCQLLFGRVQRRAMDVATRPETPTERRGIQFRHVQFNDLVHQLAGELFLLWIGKRIVEGVLQSRSRWTDVLAGQHLAFNQFSCLLVFVFVGRIAHDAYAHSWHSYYAFYWQWLNSPTGSQPA